MSKLKNEPSIQKVLSAVLLPYYTKQYVGIEDLAKDVNGIIDYAVDLFKSISKNHNYCFGRTFGYSVTIMQDKFIVTDDYSDSRDQNAFMTFIGLLQFLFIDEGIYLKGKIDISQMIRSGDALFGTFYEPFSNADNDEIISISVSRAVYDTVSETVIDNNGQCYLAFLDVVYSYSPFKEEEGNMLRHIITPIKNTLKESSTIQQKQLDWIINYCNEYTRKNNFSSKLQINKN